MHAWEQIQITLDYVEEHLSEELEIESLAQMASLSPFYYQRLFRRLVKKPVAEYIKLRRMARSTEALLQPDKRILEVALDLGFSSHEQFTRSFKNTFGLTPEEYRKNPVVLNRMTKPQLSLHYTLVDEGVPLVTDGIILELNRKTLHAPEYFIGLEAKMPVSFLSGLGTESGEDPLCSLWDSIHQRKGEGELSQLLVGEDEIGVSLPCKEEGYFCYFAGAQAKEAIHAEPFKTWELAAGEYIVCSFEAESFEALVMDALYKAHQYLFQTWLPNHHLTTEAFSVERYEGHGKGTTKMEIWVKPIA